MIFEDKISLGMKFRHIKHTNDKLVIGWSRCQDFKCMRLAQQWAPGKTTQAFLSSCRAPNDMWEIEKRNMNVILNEVMSDGLADWQDAMYIGLIWHVTEREGNSIQIFTVIAFQGMVPTMSPRASQNHAQWPNALAQEYKYIKYLAKYSTCK